MKYRVIIQVSYHEAWYEFNNAEEAVAFAGQAVQHQVKNEDTNKATGVNIRVIDMSIETQEEED